MASNKHKVTLSLQQDLDSILNDDPENDVSKKESSEEEIGCPYCNNRSLDFTTAIFYLFNLLLWPHILLLQQQTMVI